jgi:hypothetical protein
MSNKTTNQLIETLKHGGYMCEAGRLENNLDFIELAARAVKAESKQSIPERRIYRMFPSNGNGLQDLETWVNETIQSSPDGYGFTTITPIRNGEYILVEIQGEVPTGGGEQ